MGNDSDRLTRRKSPNNNPKRPTGEDCQHASYINKFFIHFSVEFQYISLQTNCKAAFLGCLLLKIQIQHFLEIKFFTTKNDIKKYGAKSA
jgi:hypothetical protein